jgi:C4-dicarboxylate transporter DctM subunit
MVIATLFILLFALMLVGVPVAVSLGATTLITSFFLQIWI